MSANLQLFGTNLQILCGLQGLQRRKICRKQKIAIPLQAERDRNWLFPLHNCRGYIRELCADECSSTVFNLKGERFAAAAAISADW